MHCFMPFLLIPDSKYIKGLQQNARTMERFFDNRYNTLWVKFQWGMVGDGLDFFINFWRGP